MTSTGGETLGSDSGESMVTSMLGFGSVLGSLTTIDGLGWSSLTGDASSSLLLEEFSNGCLA